MRKVCVTIAKSSLHINEFIAHFSEVAKFSVSEIIQFYQRFEDGVKRSTIDWRIYTLKDQGVLHRISRGVYSLKEVRHYTPIITRSNKLLYSSIKQRFPFADVCLWSTMWINEFMLHQPGQFFTILEVEKEVMEAVFYELQERGKDVYLNPSEEILDRYISNKKKPLVIIPLVSEAPTQEVNKVTTITLEKMLVDLLVNKTLFSAQQGSELIHIFRITQEKYAISNAKLLRYASRRNKKEEAKSLLQRTQRVGN